MGRVFSRAACCWTFGMLLAVTFAWAAPPAGDADLPMKKASKKLHGRLPAYYGQVVSERQREEIYRIQAEYDEKIDSLQNQLNLLKEERKGRIAAVLTEEQKKQMEKAVAEARTKRAAKAKIQGNPPAEP